MRPLGQHRLLFAAVASLLALSPAGCVVLPPQPGPSGGSVNADVIDYMRREWPLHGEACGSCCGSACGVGCCDACGPECSGLGGCGGCDGPKCWNDDWSQAAHHHKQPKMKRVPMVPLEPGPPGRFFPAPTKPAFEPTAHDY